MDSGAPEPLNVLDIQPARGELARRVADLTRERDAAVIAVTAERARNAALMRQCDQLASEMFAWRRRHARELATVRNMERSWFWRMRLVWVWSRGFVLNHARVPGRRTPPSSPPSA